MTKSGINKQKWSWIYSLTPPEGDLNILASWHPCLIKWYGKDIVDIYSNLFKDLKHIIITNKCWNLPMCCWLDTSFSSTYAHSVFFPLQVKGRRSNKWRLHPHPLLLLLPDWGLHLFGHGWTDGSKVGIVKPKPNLRTVKPRCSEFQRSSLSAQLMSAQGLISLTAHWVLKLQKEIRSQII